MNIATGKLDAPVEKQASILDAVTEAGTALAKFRGAGGEAIPYALSAGMGAGAQQATNRLLRKRLINNPKMLKALELGSATALGGGAGLTGALAAPLSKNITHSGAGSAARQLGELTAMGAGAEIALSPAVSGLLGAPVGAAETLGKMFGGGALAFGGQIAKDRRALSLLRNHYLSGAKLPRGIDPRVIGLSTQQNISQRFNSLGIPGGGLLGASGLGLMASGNPYLGAAAMLSAPLKNETTSKYMGDIIRELRAGAKKAKVDQKTKDTIDGLYKKSSYSIKLAAPVYNTHYCLDAPTRDKVAIMGLVKGIGKFVGNTGAGKATTKAYGATRNFLGEGAGKLYEGARGSRMFSGTTRQARRGRNQVMEMVNTQAPNMQNPAQVGESALLQEMGQGAAQGNVLNPIKARVAPPKPKSFSEAFSQGRKTRQAQRQQQYATTQEGYQAYVDLGAKNKPGAAPNQAQEAAGRLNTRSNVQAQAQASTQPATAVPTRAPTNFWSASNTRLSEGAQTQLDALQAPGMKAKDANKLWRDLNTLGTGRSPEQNEVFRVLSAYRRGGSISGTEFGHFKNQVRASRTNLDAFNAATNKRTTQQAAVDASPLTAPVQAGERATATPPNLAASAESQALEAASAAQRDIPVVGGRVQGAFQYRPGGNPRGTFTSADQGLEIANIRFADSQLGQDLIAIEGKGGFGKGSSLFQQGDIIQAQTQAAKKAQLHTKAATSTKATNALNAEIQQSLNLNPEASAEVGAALTELAKKSGEVNPGEVIKAVNTRLATSPGSVNALTKVEEAAITTAFAGKSGKAFSAAQRDLDGAMNLYNSNLKSGLEAQLTKAETRLSDNLAKRVDKMSKETTGPMGFGQARRNATEVKDLEEVRALVETRSRIMQESGTIADRTQAAEMMRITEEALRSGSAQEIRALKQALANPGEKITSSGAASGLTRLLDTPARQKAFNLTNEQVTKFRDVVKMEGRGAGDQVKATREIFSTQAARSPNTPQGRELSQVVNDAAGAGNEAQAEAFLALGRQEGAGGSAFGKLTSGNKANYSSEGYTVAELQAMGGNPTVPTGFSGDPAKAAFERYMIRGQGTISENIAAIDKQIDKARQSLGKAKNPASSPLNGEIAALEEARLKAQTFVTDQNATLADTFSLAQRAEQGAANLVKKDMRMGNITLLNDAAKVQPPKNMDLDATRSALEAAASSDPAQHSKMVEGIFSQYKSGNPMMSDVAIARKMVNDRLISAEQLAAMGGAEAFAAGTTQQAGGGAMNALITGGGLAGLSGYIASKKGPGPATQGQQQVKKKVVESSWGLSPLDAPVIRSKLASPIKPISLKSTKPKLPDMLKAPTQSPTTATAESMQSLLMAPVGGM